MVADEGRARLESALRDAETLLIDTSVAIAYLKGTERTSALATVILDDYVRSGRYPAVLSTITLMELLVQPLRLDSDVETVLDFARSFPNLQIVPVSESVALASAQIRAQYNLKTPDAIIVGSALLLGPRTHVVTNDGAWARITQIPMCCLEEMLG